MDNSKILIAIIDDHTLFRQSLAHLLTESEEVEVLFDAGDGEDMKAKLGKNAAPQVILMDITMPVMNGYESTKWLRQNYPEIKVLALSMFEEDQPIIDMLKSGAGGYMLKQSTAGDLIYAIKTIAKSSYFINEHVSGKLLNNIQYKPETQQPVIMLSDNELRFLELSCSELTYKEIAARMNLSPFTINNYREALFERFETKSRTGLVIYALKHNLIQLP